MSFARSEWNPRRARKGSAQQLKDLDVERVDGVDKPATGRSFLLFKNEDGLARSIQPRLRTPATSWGFMTPESFEGEGVRPPAPYEFSEPDADERVDENFLAPGEEAGHFPRGIFDNIVFRAAPNGAFVFDLKDQPAGEMKPGHDRPQWDHNPDRDAIPSAGAGPMYNASGEELFRPAGAARFPDGRQWIEKHGDRAFRVSFASILD